MKRELRDQWATALRSGAYKQGRGQMHDPVANTFDCFGVLCRVAGKDPYGEGVNDIENTDPEEPGDADITREILSKRTCDEFGITECEAAEFVALNDGTLANGVWKHFTFEEIAAIVESMEAEEDGETIYEFSANILMLKKTAELLGGSLELPNDVIISFCVRSFKGGM